MNTQTHTVEKAEMRDLPRILEIYAYARNFGNLRIRAEFHEGDGESGSVGE